MRTWSCIGIDRVTNGQTARQHKPDPPSCFHLSLPKCEGTASGPTRPNLPACNPREPPVLRRPGYGVAYPRAGASHKLDLTTRSSGGAFQFLDRLGGRVWGKSRRQRSLRQQMSRHHRASTPAGLQYCPVRLNRH
jgi:hypothetical protein